MSANNPTTPPPPNPSADEAAQKKAADDAAALRYAAAHLTAKPLPPDFDPNKRATVGEALSSIKREDFTRVHQAPCTREGLLTGIGGGAAVGALRYLTGGMSLLSLSPSALLASCRLHRRGTRRQGCLNRSRNSTHT